MLSKVSYPEVSTYLNKLPNIFTSFLNSGVISRLEIELSRNTLKILEASQSISDKSNMKKQGFMSRMIRSKLKLRPFQAKILSFYVPAYFCMWQGLASHGDSRPSTSQKMGVPLWARCNGLTTPTTRISKVKSWTRWSSREPKNFRIWRRSFVTKNGNYSSLLWRVLKRWSAGI